MAAITDTDICKVNDYKDKISDELIFIDVKPYSHNIVNCLLRGISELTDKATTNLYIREVGLDKRGWKLPDDFYTENGITRPTELDCEIYSIRQRILGEKALGIGLHGRNDGRNTDSETESDDDDE